MRHVWTLIAAAVISPLSWLLLAYGQDRSVQAFAGQEGAGRLAKGDFVGPTVGLAAAGLLLGLIATLRFSPLGATLAGTAYAGSYLALLVDPDKVWDVLPKSFSMAGHSLDLTTPPRTGTTLVLGALLLVAVVSRDRWRRWPAPDAAVPEQDEAPPILLDDRPVGIDGLELTRTRSGGPEPTPEPVWANRHGNPPPSDWPPSR
ncbi:hypothetical protein SAMN05421812_1158 [Asanoa hainanensis]|uniref:Tryptophan-associated transmembrane protein (Trp_oprn_chp) n=1 Tax=Asanoa hainanensis TaxID=560556 RepID=A0A239P801_9ACTN|nr:hypothetical protein [Asanoa hainanensis]SNT63145.1 hypothetical protein SAMN05421812_1158 [Asanoa hainanensis]